MKNAVERPFKAMLMLGNGERLFFDVSVVVAKEDVTRFVMRPDSSLLPGVLAKLDDRAILLEGLLRYYGFVVRGGSGLFYMDDEEGRPWAVPARNVLALFVDDPSEKRPQRRQRRGHEFERGRDDSAESTTAGH